MSLTTPLTVMALTFGLGFLPATGHECPCPDPGPRAEKLDDRFATALHLTEAQKASIKELRARHKDGLEARRKAMETAWTAFREAERKPETRPEDLKILHRTASDLAFDLRQERKAIRREIGALLTPEQREKAAYLLGRMEARRGSHRGHDHEGDRERRHELPPPPPKPAQ